MSLHVFWPPRCAGCPLKAKCTTGNERRLKRWEHEAVLDALQTRLERAFKAMRATVEHPFGTLKAWMGATQRGAAKPTSASYLLLVRCVGLLLSSQSGAIVGA